MLFFQIFPVSLKIIIMWFPNAGFSCICCIIEIHPIMVKHLFSECSKGAFSLREFVNLYDPLRYSSCFHCPVCHMQFSIWAGQRK